MAEEIDIKSVWNRSKSLENPSSLSIDKLERKSTKTTLYWIKIILWIEFGLTIVFAPIAIVYFMSEYSIGVVSGYIAICIIYLFYYQFLIYQIRKFNYDRDVLQNLKKVYGYLRFYVLHYYVVFWISFIIGFFQGYSDASAEAGSKPIETTGELAFIIALSVVTIAIVGGIFHFLIYLIYGRKIKRLRRMVKDLESDQ